MNERDSYSEGFTFYRQGYYSEAESLFGALTKQYPWNAHYWQALASAQQQAGKIGEALKNWCVLAALDQNSPRPHYHVAECLLALNEPAKALYALGEAKKRCLDNDPLIEQIMLLNEIWSSL